MNLDLTALDAALVARIAAQVSAFGSVRTLDSVETLRESAARPPAAHVLVNGAAWTRPEGLETYQPGDVTVTVYIQARHLGGAGKARTESGTGAYALIAATVDALRNYTVSGVCGPLQLVDVAAQEVSRTQALYAVTFVADTNED